MIERLVVGISEEDYFALMVEASTNERLEATLMKFTNRIARKSDGCRVVDYGTIPKGATGTWDSLELARWMIPLIAKTCNLPADTLHIYKERVNAELVE